MRNPRSEELNGGAAGEFDRLLGVILGRSESLLGRLGGRDYEEVVEIKHAALLASHVCRHVATGSRFASMDIEHPRSRAGRPTILLVEDDGNVRRVLHNIFEEKGFNLLEAEGGEEALLIARYHEGRIDVLVSDAAMSEINGTELAARLKAVRPELHILLISGCAPERDRLESIPFPAKPFSSRDLLGKIQEALESRQMAGSHAAP